MQFETFEELKKYFDKKTIELSEKQGRSFILEEYTENGISISFYGFDVSSVTIDGDPIGDYEGEYYPLSDEDEEHILSVWNSRNEKTLIKETKNGIRVYTCPETQEHMKAHSDVSENALSWAIEEITIPDDATFWMGEVKPGISGLDRCVEVPADLWEETVTMEQRAVRNGLTPMTTLPPQETKIMTVGIRLDDDGLWTLFTAFWGKKAPKEPWDCKTEEERLESEKFWSCHAIAKQSAQYDKDDQFEIKRVIKTVIIQRNDGPECVYTEDSFYVGDEPDGFKTLEDAQEYVRDRKEIRALDCSHMHISKISDNAVLFDNGLILTAFHQSDCCEAHWLDFSVLRDNAKNYVGTATGKAVDLYKQEFAFEKTDAACIPKFEKVIGAGINLIDTEGNKYFIAGYGENNGYYSTNLELNVFYKDWTIWETDIEDCQDIEWC